MNRSRSLPYPLSEDAAVAWTLTLADHVLQLHRAGRAHGALGPHLAGAPAALEPAFAAPEGAPSYLADQFALGALLCWLVTGAPPGRAQGWSGSAELHQVVLRATAPSPDARFPNLEAFALALRRWRARPSDLTPVRPAVTRSLAHHLLTAAVTMGLVGGGLGLSAAGVAVLGWPAP